MYDSDLLSGDNAGCGAAEPQPKEVTVWVKGTLPLASMKVRADGDLIDLARAPPCWWVLPIGWVSPALWWRPSQTLECAVRATGRGRSCAIRRHAR